MPAPLHTFYLRNLFVRHVAASTHKHTHQTRYNCINRAGWADAGPNSNVTRNTPRHGPLIDASSPSVFDHCRGSGRLPDPQLQGKVIRLVHSGGGGGRRRRRWRTADSAASSRNPFFRRDHRFDLRNHAKASRFCYLNKHASSRDSGVSFVVVVDAMPTMMRHILDGVPRGQD